MKYIPIALAMIICTLLATNSYQKIRMNNGKISVKGCAEKQITSDFVKWDGNFSTTALELPTAYEKLEKDLALLQDYFANEGVDPTELTFSPIRTNILYTRDAQGYNTNTIEGYTLSQEFSIATANIDLIKHLSQNITTLIKDGVEVASYTPQYFYRRIDELKILMLGLAAQDAKARADTLLKNTGSHTGALLSAHQGVFQITPAFSCLVSDYGEYDTSSVDKMIKAVVTMEFAID